MKRRHNHRPLWRIFRAPVLLAVGTTVGLVVGLLGDGPMDVAAAVGLALPLAAIVWAMTRR